MAAHYGCGSSSMFSAAIQYVIAEQRDAVSVFEAQEV
jgi:hypothetical protein